MMSRIAFSMPRSWPLVLKYTNIRSYVLTAVFVMLAVLTPWVCHQFRLAGPTFLPMHIFVLLGGLLFGWRAGLAIGFLSPFISYALSGMPALPTLPQIVVELTTYGLVAGLLREKLHLRALWALLGAMVAGRLALTLAVLAIYLVTGSVSSPLGPEAGPFTAVGATIRQGWPGMVIQLALVPVVVWLVGRLAARTPIDG